MKCVKSVNPLKALLRERVLFNTDKKLENKLLVVVCHLQKKRCCCSFAVGLYNMLRSVFYWFPHFKHQFFIVWKAVF